MTSTSLIGIDWGTSNVRGFRFDAAGNSLETRRFVAGLKQVAAGAWEATFTAQFGDWVQQQPDAPVLMCGMVGSRQGWSEAPYLACPVHCDALAERLHRIPGTSLKIISGLCTVDPDGTPDVMRGEETQLAGLDASGRRAVCLPGTHSKWVQIDGGRVIEFRTMMTGELFDLLLRHSLLARMSEPGADDEAAFFGGIDRGGRSAGLLHDLFAVRTLRLFDKLAPTSVTDYLSGLLIGYELASVEDMIPQGTPVTVIGSPELTSRYLAALTRRHRAATVIDGETAAAQGLWRIAVRARLAPSP
ncbi:MAG: 2-dehydro-3-deoxygalactonokinase [Planctomycetaceae bacterium]